MKVRVQGSIHCEIILVLKMTNRTHTNGRKMVQHYYLVPDCVISMFKFIFINRSMLVWSALEKSHCTLALKARWWD